MFYFTLRICAESGDSNANAVIRVVKGVVINEVKKEKKTKSATRKRNDKKTLTM